MDESKRMVVKVLEREADALAKRLEIIGSEKKKLEEEETEIITTLSAYRQVLTKWGVKQESAKPGPLLKPVAKRGRKPRRDLDSLLRAPLLDHQEHHLRDILGAIRQEHGIIIAYSTARGRYEKMSDVKKAPGRVAYRLQSGMMAPEKR